MDKQILLLAAKDEVINSIKKSKNYLKYKLNFDEQNQKIIYTLNNKNYTFFITSDWKQYSLTCSHYSDIKHMVVSIKKDTISDEKINQALSKLIKWINSTENFFIRTESHIKKLNKIISTYIKRNYKTDLTEFKINISVKKDVKYRGKKTETISPFDTRKNIAEIKYDISTNFLTKEETIVFLNFLYEKGVLTLIKEDERFNRKDISKIIRAEKLKNLLNF